MLVDLSPEESLIEQCQLEGYFPQCGIVQSIPPGRFRHRFNFFRCQVVCSYCRTLSGSREGASPLRPKQKNYAVTIFKSASNCARLN
jgi:hypothetical protein